MKIIQDVDSNLERSLFTVHRRVIILQRISLTRTIPYLVKKEYVQRFELDFAVQSSFDVSCVLLDCAERETERWTDQRTEFNNLIEPQ